MKDEVKARNQTEKGGDTELLALISMIKYANRRA
jgi:hypothetical protein